MSDGRPPGRAALVALTATVVLFVTLGLRDAREDPSVVPLPVTGHVTVLPLLGIGLNDVSRGDLPALVGIADQGASAALATRASPAGNAAEALDRLGFEEAAHEGHIRIGGSTLPRSMELPAIGVGARTRTSYLREVNAAVERERSALPDDTVLVVVGLTPPGRSWQLTPLVVFGRGVRPGALRSASTHRSALAIPADVSVSVGRIIGQTVPAPGPFPAQPLAVVPGGGGLTPATRIEEAARVQGSALRPTIDSWVLVLAVVLAFGTLLAVRRRRLRLPYQIGLLTVAAWPMATFLVGLIHGWDPEGGRQAIAVWGLAGAAACLASALGRHDRPWLPLQLVATSTVVVIVGDLALGGHLQSSTVLGTTPNVGARFYGLGNFSFGVLAGASLVAAVLLARRAISPAAGAFSAAGLLAMVTVAIGAPSIGADVGGVLAFAPASILVVVSLAGGRVKATTVVVAGAAGIAIAVGLAGLDLLAPYAARTHAGRFLNLAAGRNAGAAAIIRHKWANTTSHLGAVRWLMVIAAAAVPLGCWLFGSGGSRRPESRVTSPALVGLAAAAVLGVFLNDSGISVGAFVIFWAGPLLGLALTNDDGGRPAGQQVRDGTESHPLVRSS